MSKPISNTIKGPAEGVGEFVLIESVFKAGAEAMAKKNPENTPELVLVMIAPYSNPKRGSSLQSLAICWYREDTSLQILTHTA